jgi:hypothetical protein
MEEAKGKGGGRYRFKLWYTCTMSTNNGVGIVLDKSLKDGVVDIKCQGDRIWFSLLLVLTPLK